VVYIQEAHALDAWQDDDNIKAHIFQRTERTLSERCSVAGTCVTKLGIEFPALIDDLANTTERAYTAWPDRLYVIDRDGRVAYKSKPGPWGFKPQEVSQSLERLFPKTRAAAALPPPAAQAAASRASAIQ
jgi:type I thyroxine 5'-deiodinase